MMQNVIVYSLDKINEISSNFNAELDIEVINQLKPIKNNSVFCKYQHPINIRYTVSASSWRGESQYDNVIEITSEIFESKIISNLNKLAASNYKVIKKEIIELFKNIKSLDIDTKKLVDILFSKGAEEHIYSNIYSKLLAELLDELDANNVLNEYITQKCLEFYNDNLSLDVKEIDTELDYDEICSINKDKKLVLGSIIFISNLFNYNLIEYSLVAKYYKSLVDMTREVDKDSIGIYIDTLCAIITTCGKSLKNSNEKEFSQNFLNILIELSKDRKRVKPKYRFKIKDVIELF